MIISRTPFRISFFGGGTDYPAWYHKYGGMVLGTAIDKYCYISVRRLPPFFQYKHRIVYSQMEHANEVSEIRHPAVRGVLETLGVYEGLEIHHDGDLPARSGLGSSSSFTVGFINALRALQGGIISKKDLANLAIHVEQKILKETVGCQDQILSAYGGFNLIEFRTDDTFDLTPLVLKKDRVDEFQRHMMLFFTGITRVASEIAKTQIQNLEHRIHEINRIHEMTKEAVNIITNDNTPECEFGKLLHEYWRYKRSLSDKVSNPTIDRIYEAAIEAGADGGKLLGAGGGGFMLFFVKPELQGKVREKLKDLTCVQFRLDYSGSKIVIYEPNNFQ
ncbi:MAG: kinase [Omnitrophica bacterium GWA2_50_21]|nr:MAG: kinase [Omnitrophica bacterium GWA2_50_21]